MIDALNWLVFLFALGILLVKGGNVFIAAVGGFSIACAIVYGLLCGIGYQGPPLSPNEPFSWALAHPKIRSKKPRR